MLDRFRAFWQRQGRLSKIALVAAVVVFALVVIGELVGGSDDGSDDAVETTTVSDDAAETTTAVQVADDPIACLDDLGLSNVEQRSNDFWRGYNDSPFYQVGVALLPTAAEARQAVADATDVYAAQEARMSSRVPPSRAQAVNSPLTKQSRRSSRW
jgi:hypothetical protein